MSRISSLDLSPSKPLVMKLWNHNQYNIVLSHSEALLHCLLKKLEERVPAIDKGNEGNEGRSKTREEEKEGRSKTREEGKESQSKIRDERRIEAKPRVLLLHQLDFNFPKLVKLGLLISPN